MNKPLMICALSAVLLLGPPQGLAQDAGQPGSCPRPEACRRDDQSRPNDDCTPNADCPFNSDDRPAANDDNRKRNRSADRRGGKRGKRRAKRDRSGRRGDDARQGRQRNRRRGDQANGNRNGPCNDLDQVVSDGAQTVPDEYLARLQFVLEREFYARDYYVAASDALGGVRVFDNLARAEQRHADAVVNMIRIVGGTAVPEHDVEFELPTTIAEADAACEAIERLVIGLYADLIEACPDDRILAALESIQASNFRHLSKVE